jgi:hypothetical protein
MNFGVTADGYLFSQSGRIGGWIIGTNTLQSANGSIILDGENNIIQLGAIVDSVMSGTVKMAGYFLEGNTIAKIEVTAGDTEASTEGGDAVDEYKDSDIGKLKSFTFNSYALKEDVTYIYNSLNNWKVLDDQ